MRNWLRPDGESLDAWTPERKTKLRILDAAAGNVEAAREVWGRETHARFGVFLARTGRITDWPDDDR